MTFVIYHNTDTGNLGVYANKEAAQAGQNTGMPIYTTEAQLLDSKATGPELVRFFNKITGQNVAKFSDRKAAVRRIWAAAAGAPVTEPVAQSIPAGKTDTPAQPTPVATEEKAAEAKKRGRQKGTGKFAGKTVFATKQGNPRRAGTAGFKSYEIIRGKADGVPYSDYIAAGGRPNDLQWDIDHKWAEVK